MFAHTTQPVEEVVHLHNANLYMVCSQRHSVACTCCSILGIAPTKPLLSLHPPHLSESLIELWLLSTLVPTYVLGVIILSDVWGTRFAGNCPETCVLSCGYHLQGDMDPTASLMNCTHLHMHDHCMIMTLFLACLTNTCIRTECTLVYLDVHCTKGIWKLKIWRTLSLEGDYIVLRLFQWVLTVGEWFSFFD